MSEAADYSIRALQSKHKLVQAVPVKDPTTGTIRTRTLEVEGPAAFLETTTEYIRRGRGPAYQRDCEAWRKCVQAAYAFEEAASRLEQALASPTLRGW